MKRLIFLFGLCALFAGKSHAQTTFAPPSPSAPTRATTTVAVLGRVVNGTRNDAKVGNVQIRFVRAEAGVLGGAPVGVAKSQPDGVFGASLNVARQDIVFARIDWQGYPYLFPVYDGENQLGANIDPRGQTLRLFDTTDEAPREMSVMSHQVMLQNDGAKVHVTEELIVENASNKTYIGSKVQNNTTILLAIPAGAEEVSADAQSLDAQLITLDGASGQGKSYAIAKPILPQMAGGNPRNNAITISYHLPWTREVNLSRRLLYPTKYFAVVRAQSDEQNLLVSAPQLGAARKPTVPMGAGAQSIVNAAGRPMGRPVFASGTTLNIALTRPTKPIIWVFIGLTGLLVLWIFAVFAWPFLLLVIGLMIGKSWASQKQSSIEYSKLSQSVEIAHSSIHDKNVEHLSHVSALGGKSAEPSVAASVYTGNYRNGQAKNTAHGGTLSDDARQLIAEIAALDDAHDDGELPHDDYHAERSARKTQLKSLLKSLLKAESKS